MALTDHLCVVHQPWFVDTLAEELARDGEGAKEVHRMRRVCGSWKAAASAWLGARAGEEVARLVAGAEEPGEGRAFTLLRLECDTGCSSSMRSTRLVLLTGPSVELPPAMAEPVHSSVRTSSTEKTTVWRSCESSTPSQFLSWVRDTLAHALRSVETRKPDGRQEYRSGIGPETTDSVEALCRDISVAASHCIRVKDVLKKFGEGKEGTTRHNTAVESFVLRLLGRPWNVRVSVCSRFVCSERY